MSRLTTKIEDGFYVADHAHNTDEVIHKLGKLEDLEEQLGCPLEVFFKWLKADYVYAYSEERKEFERFTNYALDEMFNKKEMIFQLVDYEYDDDFGGGAVFMELKLSDYKKTWWLKEDKSE